MTAIYPTAAGNWSTRTWNVCSTGLAYGTTPQVGDDVYANNVAITIDQDIHVNSLRNAANGSAAAGGSFNVSSVSGTRTLTVDTAWAASAGVTLSTISAGSGSVVITGSSLAITAGSTGTAISFPGSADLSVTCANITGGSGTGVGISTVGGSGNLTINCSGDIVGGGVSTGYGVSWGSTTTGKTANITAANVKGGSTSAGINSTSAKLLTLTAAVSGVASGSGVGLIVGAGNVAVIGNVTGGQASGATLTTGTLAITGNVAGGGGGHGVTVTGAGTLTVSGTSTGGSSGSSHGINLTASNANITLTGAAIGGSSATCYGVNFTGTAPTAVGNLNGGATGGSVAGAAGVNNASTGTINITGTVQASSTAPAVADSLAVVGVINIVGGPVVNNGNIAGVAAGHVTLNAAMDFSYAQTGGGALTIGNKGASSTQNQEFAERGAYSYLTLGITVSSASSPTDTSTVLNTNQVFNTSGGGFGIGFRAIRASAIKRIYTFVKTFNGTPANTILNGEIRNMTGAQSPGSTVRQAAVAATFASQTNGHWAKFDFSAVPYTPAIGEPLFLNMSNAATVPGTDYPQILTSSGMASAIQGFGGYGLKYCYTTTNGWTSITNVGKNPTIIIEYTDGSFDGIPYTKINSTFYASSTLERGIVIEPQDAHYVIWGAFFYPSFGISTIKIYQGNTAPGGAAYQSFSPNAVDQGQGQIVFNTPFTLYAGTKYRAVAAFGSSVQIPAVANIESASDFTGLLSCGSSGNTLGYSTIDNGAGGWTDDKSAFGGIALIASKIYGGSAGGGERSLILVN